MQRALLHQSRQDALLHQQDSAGPTTMRTRKLVLSPRSYVQKAILRPSSGGDTVAFGWITAAREVRSFLTPYVSHLRRFELTRAGVAAGTAE